MKKTRIKFEDIKAGDLIETSYTAHGVKEVLTGIVFEKKTTRSGFTEWSTAQGGLLVDDVNEVAIYRIDVAEVSFQDVKVGDIIRVTYEPIHGDMIEIVKTGVAFTIVNGTWVTPAYEGLVSNNGRGKIEILERAE